MKTFLSSARLSAFATFLVAAGLVSKAVADDRSRPNIVLVLADDVGYGDFACLGNPIIKTPNVDAFWKESVRFTDFQVSPTCAPTRSAIMTGRHEFKNGVTHTIYERERLTLSAKTIAEVLQDAGYSTGIFGKWHLGDEAAYRPDRRGFDETFIHGGGGIGQTFPGSCGDAPGNTNIDPAILHNGVFEKRRGYCTDIFFDRAIGWMNERRGSGKPFFAYIPLNAAHDPHVLPEAYYRRYLDKVPDDTAKFYGMIENIDANFGALLAKLRAWGIVEKTLIVFMTDNGGTAGVKIYNAGMRGAKVTPWQGGIRVPSFWRWPAGFSGGRDCDALTAHIDLFPTFVEIAGAKPSAKVMRQVEGRSLLPLLKNPVAEWPDRVLVTHVGRWPKGKSAEWKYKNVSIRNSRYALVNNAELFDLKVDPGQRSNLIDRRPEVAAELRREYERWWDSIQVGLVNENVEGPKINPFKELYWKQFGGGPDEALRRRMDPSSAPELKPNPAK